ncbi:hypothetical protein, partial [Sphingobium sp.]|uniref:hypothetical protein n=1 Tax=Sphingobium sp. TaxID=1912891 RepID=UPI0028BDF3A6
SLLRHHAEITRFFEPSSLSGRVGNGTKGGSLLSRFLDEAAWDAFLANHQARKGLQQLEEQLQQIEGEVRNAASVALVFDGGPVRGFSAIDADFAGQALQDYQELVAKLATQATLAYPDCSLISLRREQKTHCPRPLSG